MSSPAALYAELVRKAPRRRGHPEDDIQRAVCKYWALKHRYTWERTWHTPNGLAAKNKKLAAIFAGLGVKPGVFDLVCIARRGPYTGFALELKSAHGRMSDEQENWQTRFILEGYYVAVAFTLEAAISSIDFYHTHELSTPMPQRKQPPPRGDLGNVFGPQTPAELDAILKPAPAKKLPSNRRVKFRARHPRPPRLTR
jgi:hypothetical protein